MTTTTNTTTWPPEREPQTEAERREWLHTHPDIELCSCAGSGLYYSADGFERHDCPHHDGQRSALDRCLDIEADLLAAELVADAHAELDRARKLAALATFCGLAWLYFDAALTVLERVL